MTDEEIIIRECMMNTRLTNFNFSDIKYFSNTYFVQKKILDYKLSKFLNVFYKHIDDLIKRLICKI